MVGSRRSRSYRVVALTENPHDTRHIRSIAMPPTAGDAARVYDVLLVMVSGVSVPLLSDRLGGDGGGGSRRRAW